MKHQLVATLERIIDLLDACGESSHGTWLRERLGVLEQEGIEAMRFKEVLREIKHELAGMGSFTDLSLIPVPGSRMTRQEARKKQWDLAESLDEAITVLLADNRCDAHGKGGVQQGHGERR